MTQGGEAAAEAHIVIVDDEPHLREMLARYLCKHGFDAVALSGGSALREHLLTREPDLVVLDLNMPEEHGLSIARHLLERSSAAVLMLTGAGDPIDRIVGLEIGADDYVVKPADPREVMARIRAILRRGRSAPAAATVLDPPPRPPSPPAPAPADPALLRMGRCRLDLETWQLLDEVGNPLPLTGLEIELLRAFVERPNRIITRDQLLELAGDRDREPFDRSIDVRIARLRKKIEHDPANPQAIRTVRGAGYMYVPESA